MKVSTHVIIQILATIIQVGNMVLPIAGKYQMYVTLIVSLAQAGLAWYNQYFNPDGTSASVPYIKENKVDLKT